LIKAEESKAKLIRALEISKEVSKIPLPKKEEDEK
jgi:hypothetical protein